MLNVFRGTTFSSCGRIFNFQLISTFFSPKKVVILKVFAIKQPFLAVLQQKQTTWHSSAPPAIRLSRLSMFRQHQIRPHFSKSLLYTAEPQISIFRRCPLYRNLATPYGSLYLIIPVLALSFFTYFFLTARYEKHMHFVYVIQFLGERSDSI